MSLRQRVALVVMSGALSWASAAAPAPSPADELHPPIPVRFALTEPGYVTLVIEDANGVRVRNLLSETLFPAGPQTAWWDGLDDIGRDNDAAAHAVYHIPGKQVAAGRYRVRGLVRPRIDLHYQMTPYNEGNPPWPIADRSGEWLANHTAPSAVLYVPPGAAPKRPAGDAPGGQIIVASHVSEGGSGVAWLDLSGRKLHGQMWIGGVWTGATHLARDAGDRAVGGVYAYTGAWWKGDKYNNNQEELRLYQLLSTPDEANAPRDKRFGTGEDSPVLRPTFKLPPLDPNAAGRPMGLGGLAAWNGKLVVSLPLSNQVLFVDAAQHKVIGLAGLDDPRGLAFDRQGRLLAISGGQLLRFDLPPLPVPSAAPPADPNASPGFGQGLTLPKPSVLIARGLENPQQLAQDDAGNLYISDGGPSDQVKVFSPEGRFLRAIGQAGGPRVGPYDPNHMNNPTGLTISPDGHLWVAETDFAPKRLSVWTLDGELVKALYGPAEYGGGGSIDPLDKTRFFYAGMEFQLDWRAGTSRPVAVCYRGDVNAFRVARSGPPQCPVHVEGRTYLTNCYNSNPTTGATNAMIWILRDGVAVPVAAVGRADSWDIFSDVPAFSVRWTGTISPQESREYTFQAPGSVRLWIDGKRVIDNWDVRPNKDVGRIDLQAGRQHELRMEYRHTIGKAEAKLYWSTANQKKEIVPAARLAPPKSDGAAKTGLTGEYFADAKLKDLRETRTDAGINFTWASKGPLGGMENPFLARLPAGAKGPLLFAWSDLDGDGRMQPQEVTAAPGDAGCVGVMGDLSVVTSAGLLLRPQGFTPAGAPLYDLAKAVKLLDGTQRPTSSGGGEALLCKDGWLILTTAPKPFAPQGVGGAKDGVAMWSYPSLWPGLHASHNAPLGERPGEMLGTTRLLGPPVSPRGSDVGEIWAINGNFGNAYLLTTDGLFVATLFKDCRTASWSFPAARRDMLVNDASMGSENFWPSIVQVADGTIYMLSRNSAIVRVDGLEKIRRLPDTFLEVTADQLAAAREYFLQAEAKRQQDLKDEAAKTLKVAMLPKAPALDANLADWAKADWATIDQRTIQIGDWGHAKFKTQIALAVAGDRLYVALKADNSKLLENSAESPNQLFKTGGGIDLMIGADPTADPNRKTAAPGDLRLLVAQVKEPKNPNAPAKTIAMLYRPVVPGNTGEPVRFASPLRTVSFDRVEDVSDQVTLTVQIDKNEKLKRDIPTFELSVPLPVLGLKPRPGLRIRGDAGVLRGNGFQTLQRAYWSNKATGLTSDLPSEAELTPRLWGTWEFTERR